MRGMLQKIAVTPVTVRCIAQKCLPKAIRVVELLAAGHHGHSR